MSRASVRSLGGGLALARPPGNYAPIVAVSLASLIGLAIASTACSTTVSTAPPAGPPPGSAIMDWTIDEAKDPNACGLSGAATFHVSLFDPGGGLTGEFVQGCTAFATTIDGLFPQTYSARAELVDAAGNPRTTSIDVAPFTVPAAASTVVNLDFPASSFVR